MPVTGDSYDPRHGKQLRVSLGAVMGRTWHPSFQPRWEENAACRDQPPGWWFDTGGVETVQAFSICTACSVRPECLAFALDHPTLIGIWAGTTADDRRRLRRERGERHVTNS
jgi:WhiB family redox-sensing transcriptional regulator